MIDNINNITCDNCIHRNVCHIKINNLKGNEIISCGLFCNKKIKELAIISVFYDTLKKAGCKDIYSELKKLMQDNSYTDEVMITNISDELLNNIMWKLGLVEKVEE